MRFPDPTAFRRSLNEDITSNFVEGFPPIDRSGFILSFAELAPPSFDIFVSALQTRLTLYLFFGSLLFNLLFNLARTSYVLRDQLARTAGSVVLSQALRNSQSGHHLSDFLLIGFSRYRGTSSVNCL
nr:hypothetical protein HmN_000829600 [Hymenolepis microstoma]